MEQYAVVGKRLPRVDGIVKVTGEAKFVVDLNLPGMLFAKILRSPHAHAQILSIDTSRAKRLPGVKAVLTAADVPSISYSIWGGSPPTDKLPFAKDKVRYIGDEMAAVAAIDKDTAEEAVELIKVEYQGLPPVFDPEEAMSPSAPRLHDSQGNVMAHMQQQFGNIERGFAESDYICEDRFVTQPQALCCMEPHCFIVHFDHSGRLTIWTSSQSLHHQRRLIARALGISPNNIRLINGYIGGGFGGKDAVDGAPICAYLSQRTARPVRLLNTREEEFQVSGHRHPIIHILKTGVRRDGRFVARQLTTITNCGAYHRGAVLATAAAPIKINQLYNIPNTKFDGYIVYTNNPPGSPFRGVGGVQVHFAMESQTDIIAQRLGIDPMQIRLLNANKPHQVTANGSVITTCGLRECIERASAAACWNKRREKPPNRGLGMASLVHAGGGAKLPPMAFNFAEAIVKVNEAGLINLLCGEPDLGTGSDTVLSQIVAEELGVSLEDVRIVTGDTELVPFSSEGSGGSRVTFVSGNAVRNAAADARRQLFEAAAERLEANVEDLVARERKIYVKGSPEKAIAIGDAVRAYYAKTGQPVTGKGVFVDRCATGLDEKGYGSYSPTYTWATQVAEVVVDKETGQVKVLNLVAAHDLGFAINPMAAEGQIEGAATMGLGFALSEEVKWEKGQTLNPNFMDYKFLGPLDVPHIKPILVETNDPYGPYGAKGLGEPGMVGIAPAVANAVYDATGVRIKELPITPEKVLKTIRQQEKTSP